MQSPTPPSPLPPHVALTDVWPWLPAFQAVAELENLRGAAAQLRIAPSALSRSVRLLEERIGFSLFRRTPTGLRLTAQGRQFAQAVQASMAALRGALSGLDRATSAVRVAYTDESLAALAACALDDEPTTTWQFSKATWDGALGALMNAELDVLLAVGPMHTQRPTIQSLPIGEMRFGVYVRPEHPLGPETTLEQIASARFIDRTEASPLSLSALLPGVGTVAAQADSLATALAMCRSSEWLVVLPIAWCETSAVPLRRLPCIDVAPHQVSVISRAGSDEQPIATLVKRLRDLLPPPESVRITALRPMVQSDAMSESA